MNSKKQWTNDLRDKLARYETDDVPHGLWDAIDGALDGKCAGNLDVSKSSGRSVKRFVPLMRILAATAAILILAVCGVGLLWKRAIDDTTELRADSGRNNVTVNASQKASAKTCVTEVLSTMVAEDSIVQTFTADRYIDEKGEVDTGDETPLPVETETLVANANEKTDATADNSYNKLLADYKGENPEVMKSVTSSHGTVMSVAFFASNMLSSSESVDGYSSMLSARAMRTKYNGISPIVTPVQAMAYSNRYDETKTDTKHHQPIRIGAGARYFFNRRWTVETGLVYSMLESGTESGSVHSYMHSEQKVQYLGVPVTVGYQWINGSRLSVYTSAGAMAEFGIGGRLESSCMIDGNNTGINRSNISDIPVQWSLNAVAGVQYNIVGHLGIYAEPGIAYYIDNGSELKTAYSDKPLNFSMKIGLRYDFKR